MRWLWRLCHMGRGEAVDVADRGRAAELLEPAGPPTGGREMRVKHIGLEAAGGGGQARNGEQVRFAADAEPVEGNVGGEQFGVGAAAAR